MTIPEQVSSGWYLSHM